MTSGRRVWLRREALYIAVIVLAVLALILAALVAASQDEVALIRWATQQERPY